MRLAGERRGELVAHSRELLLHVRGQLVVVLLDAFQDVGLIQKKKKKKKKRENSRERMRVAKHYIDALLVRKSHVFSEVTIMRVPVVRFIY